MPTMRTVVFSIFGTVKDTGTGPDRWERWRPTLSLCRHEDFLPDRLELIHDAASTRAVQNLAEDIQAVSPETEVVLHKVHWRDPWDFADVYSALADLAAGYAFDEDEERYLVHMTTGTHVAQICLFLLAESRLLPAQLIQSSPPKGRGVRGVKTRGRTAGVGTYSIIDLDLARYDPLATRFRVEQRDAASFLKRGIETRSDAFNALIDRIEQVAARTSYPILLTGATGVGKTQLARRIFELKLDRRLVKGEFVEVNCATIRGDGAMSTLFGHERGAFTGAQSRRAGLLAAADGGLLFLDEVGELGLDEQAMLLRAIEEGTFVPLGSDRPRESAFQLIAGTNRDLYQAVQRGTFREDLLARIDLWHFELPSLRERYDDIEPNLDYELERHSTRLGRRMTMNREARRRFLEFATSPAAAWSGNFRDFAAAITRMVTLAAGARIDEAVVDAELARLESHWSRLAIGMPSGALAHSGVAWAPGVSAPVGALSAPAPDPVTQLLGEAADELDRFDRVQLAEVLDVCRRAPSLSAAGRTLFAESRKRKSSRNDADRLKKYLARYGLDWAAVSS